MQYVWGFFLFISLFFIHLNVCQGEKLILVERMQAIVSFFYCVYMLEGLKTKLENLKVDEDAAWFHVVDREVQFEIIRLNTEDQLFEDGVDSTGADLPDYSDTSVNVYGKRPGHMTLKDTGEFYQSFVVRVDRSGINIIADTQKEDKDLLEYGEIIGLTEENIGLLRDMLVINYREYLRDKLFAA